MHLIQSAIGSFMSNKLRSSLTLSGIIIGISSVVALVGLGSSIRNSIESNLSSFGVERVFIFNDIETEQVFSKDTGSTRLTNRVTLDQIESISNWASKTSYTGVTTVLSSQAAVWLVGKQAIAKNSTRDTSVQGVNEFGSNGANVFKTDDINSFTAPIAGVPDNYAEVNLYEFSAGSFFSKEHFTRSDSSRVVVIGNGIANDLFGTNRDPIGAKIAIAGNEFTVIGRVKAGLQDFSIGDLDNAVLMPINTYITEFSTTDNYTREGKVNAPVLIVSSNGRADVDNASNEVLTWLTIQFGRSAVEDFNVFNLGSILESIDRIIRAIQTFLAAVASISLFVGGVGVMNTMLVTVRQRTSEIGLRRSLGARGRDILFQFLIEAVILTLIGGIIGLIIGVGIGQLAITFFNQNPQGGEDSSALPSFALTWQVLALSLGTAAGVGLFFGIYPAFTASKLQPVEALRRD